MPESLPSAVRLPETSSDQRPRAFEPRPAGVSLRIPVLALGSGITALGVLRSLHIADVPVYSVCPRNDLVAQSRWFRPVPGARTVPDPEELPRYLETLNLEMAVLMPCSDDWVRAVSGLPDSLRTRFPASVPTPSVVDTLTDKWRFFTFVDCLGIPRPNTVRVTSIEQLESLDESAFENAFLKPVDSQEFSRQHHVKAFQLESKRHAIELTSKAVGSRKLRFPVLLQEYIPGPPTRTYLIDGFVDRSGRVQALFARHKLTQYPPVFGNSSRSETVPLSLVEEAVTSIQKMWSSIPFRGIFDAEFKYDERDGKFKIIEVNARAWWWVEFATRCRIDVCRMAYRDALEQPVQPAEDYPVDRCCTYLAYDFAAQVGRNPTVKSLLRWARSLRHTEDLVFRWDDPKPALHSIFSALKNYRRLF